MADQRRCGRGQRGLFGYGKPFQPELKVKELTAYKAVYCGLCGQLGHSFGPLARLTLSYDFTFLAMLYYSVNGLEAEIKPCRCFVNPLKKLPVCCGSEALRYSADVAVIMIYYKLLDNIHDGGPLSKIGWSIPRPVVARAHRKAAASIPQGELLIAEQMQNQTALEDAKCTSVDEACEPTAVILSGVFRQISQDHVQQRVLERLGYLLGRYVYLCDALDDLEQDLRRGGYNPFLLRYGVTGREDGRLDEIRAEAKGSLYLTIAEAERTLNLLTLGDFAPIIENVVTMGLRASVDEILSKKEQRI